LPVLFSPRPQCLFTAEDAAKAHLRATLEGELPSVPPGDRGDEGGTAQAAGDTSRLAPAKMPPSRTAPLLMREATVVTSSSSLAAQSRRASTKARSVVVTGNLMAMFSLGVLGRALPLYFLPASAYTTRSAP